MVFKATSHLCSRASCDVAMLNFKATSLDTKWDANMALKIIITSFFL